MKLLKKMSFTKQDSQDTNSVATEEGGSQVDINKELWKKEKQMRFLIRKWCKVSSHQTLISFKSMQLVEFH